MAKTIAWADQSGEVITFTAPAWSGSQTVTLSTPENFGKLRELNIVFYSESNPAVSATLNVKQAGATLSFNISSVVFGCDETHTQTVTVKTNMSTLSGASLVLEGDDASNFTLSALSALSGGTATFTIKPKSINSGTSARNATIKLTAGRLPTLSLQVTQEADFVDSTTYENYRIENPVAYYEPSGSQRSQITSSTTILAKAGTVYLGGTPTRTKVTTYASGKVDRVDEEISSSSTVYYLAGGYVMGTYWRFTKRGSTPVSTIIAGNLAISVNSLEYTLRGGGVLAIRCDISNASVSERYPSTLMTSSLCEENKRVSYSSYSSVNMPSKSITNSAQTVNISGSAYGVCSYTSLASRKENVPLKFTTSATWLSITSQTPGDAGPTLSPTSATVQVSANASTSARRVNVRAYALFEDGTISPSIVGTVTITQAAAAPKYGTLTVSASPPYDSHVYLSFFYGSVGSANQLGSPYVRESIPPILSVPTDVMNPVIDEYMTTPRAASVIVAYMKQSDPYGNPLQQASLTTLMMNGLINGDDQDVTLH